MLRSTCKPTNEFTFRFNRRFGAAGVHAHPHHGDARSGLAGNEESKTWGRKAVGAPTRERRGHRTTVEAEPRSLAEPRAAPGILYPRRSEGLTPTQARPHDPMTSGRLRVRRAVRGTHHMDVWLLAIPRRATRSRRM